MKLVFVSIEEDCPDGLVEQNSRAFETDKEAWKTYGRLEKELYEHAPRRVTSLREKENE